MNYNETARRHAGEDDAMPKVPEKMETEAKPVLSVCGIIMPISGGDPNTDEHWRRVLRVIRKAIEKAGMQDRVV